MTAFVINAVKHAGADALLVLAGPGGQRRMVIGEDGDTDGHAISLFR